MSTNEQVYIFNQTQNPDDVRINEGSRFKYRTQTRRISKDELEAWWEIEKMREEQDYAYDNGMIEEQ